MQLREHACSGAPGARAARPSRGRHGAGGADVPRLTPPGACRVRRPRGGAIPPSRAVDARCRAGRAGIGARGTGRGQAGDADVPWRANLTARVPGSCGAAVVVELPRHAERAGPTCCPPAAAGTLRRAAVAARCTRRAPQPGNLLVPPYRARRANARRHGANALLIHARRARSQGLAGLVKRAGDRFVGASSASFARAGSRAAAAGAHESRGARRAGRRLRVPRANHVLIKALGRRGAVAGVDAAAARAEGTETTCGARLARGPNEQLSRRRRRRPVRRCGWFELPRRAGDAKTRARFLAAMTLASRAARRAHNTSVPRPTDVALELAGRAGHAAATGVVLATHTVGARQTRKAIRAFELGQGYGGGRAAAAAAAAAVVALVLSRRTRVAVSGLIGAAANTLVASLAAGATFAPMKPTPAVLLRHAAVLEGAQTAKPAHSWLLPAAAVTLRALGAGLTLCAAVDAAAGLLAFRHVCVFAAISGAVDGDTRAARRAPTVGVVVLGRARRAVRAAAASAGVIRVAVGGVPRGIVFSLGACYAAARAESRGAIPEGPWRAGRVRATANLMMIHMHIVDCGRPRSIAALRASHACTSGTAATADVMRPGRAAHVTQAGPTRLRGGSHLVLAGRARRTHALKG